MKTVGSAGEISYGKSPHSELASGHGTAGEEFLIRNFIAGRAPDRFEILIRPHLPWLRRLLFTLFRGVREDMEDAEQEILAGLYCDIRRFQFRSSFKTFLYGYARHKAVDLLRKIVRRRKREAVFAHHDPSRAASPEEQFLVRERREEVADMLLALPPAEREILLMKDVEMMSIEEIAAVTGKKGGTIKSILHRSREKLFFMLEERRRK